MRSLQWVLLTMLGSGASLSGQTPMSEKEQGKLFDALQSSLRGRQRQDGSWQVSDQAGAERPLLATGLALFALMTSGASLKIGKYKPAIQAAVDWLGKHQGKDGWLGDDADTVETHAIATCGLVFAYGMSGEVHALKQPCERALRVLLARTAAPAPLTTEVAAWTAFALATAERFRLPTSTEVAKRGSEPPAAAASRPRDELRLLAELLCRVMIAKEGDKSERVEQLLREAEGLTLSNAGGTRPSDPRALLFAGLATTQLSMLGTHREPREAWCRRIEAAVEPEQKSDDRFRRLTQSAGGAWAEGIGESGRLAMATILFGVCAFHAQILGG